MILIFICILNFKKLLNSLTQTSTSDGVVTICIYGVVGTDVLGLSGVVNVLNSLVFNSRITSAREGICERSSRGGRGGAADA